VPSVEGPPSTSLGPACERAAHRTNVRGSPGPTDTPRSCGVANFDDENEVGIGNKASTEWRSAN
jgi:hypothetical protein